MCYQQFLHFSESYLQMLVGGAPSFIRVEADKFEKAADYSTDYTIKKTDSSSVSDELKKAFDSTEHIIDSMIHTFVEGHVQTPSLLQNLVGQDPSYTRAQADKIEKNANTYTALTIFALMQAKH